MNETRGLLTEAASRLFADLCTRGVSEDAERGVWPQSLWEALEAAGLTAAATATERGGAGADFGDMLALIKVAGTFSIPLPLTETLLAEQMLAAAGLPVVSGPVTVGPVLRQDRLSLVRRSGKWTLSGTLHRVPWARNARAVVVLAECEGKPRTVMVEQPRVETEGWSYAREPRDAVRFDDHAVSEAAIAPTGRGYTYDDLLFRGALCRVAAMTGALEKVLELTVNYAKERVQFGRPIGKFQAVQQQIAVLATQVAASSAAAQAAIEASAEGPAFFEIAAAKTRIGEAAGIAASIAHQVHGAMGFTHEHSLHLSTRRLWAWRDEFGSETEWASWIGTAVARVGGENLWSFLTMPSKPAVHQI